MSSTFKRILLVIIVFTVFIFGLVFYLRNEQVVEFDYLLGTLELSFSIWLLIILTMGVLLGWLTILPVIFTLKRQNVKLSRQVKMNEKEINNLRVIPLKDSQ